MKSSDDDYNVPGSNAFWGWIAGIAILVIALAMMFASQ